LQKRDKAQEEEFLGRDGQERGERIAANSFVHQREKTNKTTRS